MNNKYKDFYQKEIEKNIKKKNYSLTKYHFQSLLSK